MKRKADSRSARKTGRLGGIAQRGRILVPDSHCGQGTKIFPTWAVSLWLLSLLDSGAEEGSFDGIQGIAVLLRWTVGLYLILITAARRQITEEQH